MKKITFDKNEYSYLAVKMIFGPRSPFLHELSPFAFSMFKKQPLDVLEIDMMEEGVYNKRRNLLISGERALITSHVEPMSDVSRVITFKDPANKVLISDTLYSDQEFKTFENDFDSNTRAKVNNVGLLIQTLHLWDLTFLPLFVSEFPNITKVLLNHPEFLSSKRRKIDERDKSKD
ncbi:MAG: hypothetical protein GF334_06930 [Candidatus Altiarchaeales archaeon]|nr:hypothetical protein [Candidatus Altiarchaeales archaeon]